MSLEKKVFVIFHNPRQKLKQRPPFGHKWSKSGGEIIANVN